VRNVLLLLCGANVLAVSLNAATTLPYESDFEAPDFTPGILVSDPDWSFDSTLLTVEVIDSDSVSPDDANPGAQSLTLTGTDDFMLEAADAGVDQVRWVDFYVKPVFVVETDLTFSIGSYQSAVTGFVIDGSGGQVYAVDGDGSGSGEWVSAEVPIALAGAMSQDWVRLAYRIDYANKRWDLYINNQLVIADLGFLDDGFMQLNKVAVSADETRATGFDHFYVGDISQVDLDGDGVAELDTDNDGIADFYELDNGMNALADDRAGDVDNDSVSNIEEYISGLLAGTADSDLDGVHDGQELRLGNDPVIADAYSLNSIPFTADFEAASLGSIDGVNLWSVESGTATVQTAEVASGTQAVELAAASQELAVLSNNFDGSGYAQVWIDFQIKPVFWGTDDGPDVADFLYAPLGVFYFNEGNQVTYLNGDRQGSGTWETVAATLDSAQWQRVTLYNDYTAQTWSLWLNGVRVAQDIGFVHAQPYFNHMTFQQGDGASAFFDDLTAATTEPAALDNDGDLLQNSDESLLGSDPNLVDTDTDGLADSIEVNLGFDPAVADSNVAILEQGQSGFSTYATTFSTAEGYTPAALDGQLGWNADAVATVTSSESVSIAPVEGSEASLDHLIGAGDAQQLWVSFKARMVTGSQTSTPVGEDAGALQFTFVAEGVLSVWNPESMTWVQLPTTAKASDYNHFAAYLDYEAKVWDLWINGQEVFTAWPLSGDSSYTLSRLKLIQGNHNSTGIFDDLVVTTDAEQARHFSRQRPYLYAGRASGVSSETWQRIELPRVYRNPVVVATPVYDKSVELPAVVRVNGIKSGATSFEIRVQNPSEQAISDYDVEYLVVEAGVYTKAIHDIDLEAASFEVNRVDQKNSWLGQQVDLHTIIPVPIVLGQVMSSNDSRWSVFWSHGGSRGNPVGSQLFVGRHVGEDTDLQRLPEKLGYIVIGAGSGILEGHEYLSALSADNLTHSPRSLALSNQAITSLTHLVAAQSAMDVADGGFVILDEPNSMTSSSFVLAIDEDQIRDTDRAHTTEQASYFALGSVTTWDSDADNLPDWWERWYADVNPFDEIETLQDVTASLDSDGDGVSDYDEDVVQGTDFQNAYDNDPAGKSLVYANSSIGDDSNSGRAPIQLNEFDGPKQTIAVGMEVARDDEVLVVSDGTYDETILSLNGKNLTLRLNGSVTIR
tara:strand:+ start:309 stop:3845 length:3537 start_codon:yes stop_codon:yes gene_type:complete